MPPMTGYDVAVVGYGPVGATAANLLGAMGLHVLVVERDADLYSRARAVSTDEEVVRIWQRTGLADRLTADMLADRPLTFVDAAGRTFLSFTPRTQGNGHPPQLFVHQPALERTLRAGVDRYPDVEVLLGHECTGLAQDASSVALTIRGPGGDARHARATYVIAADGGSSPTRTRLGIGFEGRTYEDRWIVIDTEVRKPWPEADRLRFHCDPDRPAVDCPTPLGHHRWEFPVLPGDDEATLTSPEGVRQLLAGQGISPEHVDVLGAVVYRHHVRFADRWRVGRVFLAGDAAHVMPPWIGQGMASGVRDVDNLCWKLAAAVDGRTPAAVVERLLESYETERMPHVRAITRAAVFFGRVVSERRRPVAAVRNRLFRTACRLPGVGSFLRDARWFPVTAYRRGLLATRPGRRGARRAVGAHIPQPWVLDEKGRRARLDDVLGRTRWAVLHTGPVDPRPGLPAFALRPAGSEPGPGAVVDVENLLLGWMGARHVAALVVRPDGIVFAAAGPDEPIPAPPVPTAPAP
jgi:3-(3-hydroxy-phenyl)propionate hydroxylase